MRVVFVAAECEPFAKTGGLADVVDALARALAHVPRALSEPVEVFLPRYRDVAAGADATTAVRVVRVPDPFAADGGRDVPILTVPSDGYRLRLVDVPQAFDRAGYYGDAAGDYDDNEWRFGLLCRAALETRRAEGRPVDVLGLHDWHACPAVLQRDLALARDPVVGRAAAVLTVHNPAFHGWIPRERAVGLGLGVAAESLGDDRGLDLLAEGVRRAEMITTVSPGYAREILGPDQGMGLDAELRARGDRFVGILNGLDTRLWDPATDPVIAARYDRADRSGKAVCRADLLARLGMDPADAGPVVAVVGRVHWQKGSDLVSAAAGDLVARGVRLVLLGSGEAGMLDAARSAALARPDRLAIVDRFDRDLSRRIYAGADMLLMPSRFEPCGQCQMIALRYGTPPVARRTGGLADSIVDLDQWPDAGTGFLFEDASVAAVV
ncbi:MAG: glycogen synthase, partial [Chloroflexi bacterium]|nr:glycogen synthase [Chloroflexota bacterium]